MCSNVHSSVAAIKQFKRLFHETQGRCTFMVQRANSRFTHLRPPTRALEVNIWRWNPPPIKKTAETHIFAAIAVLREPELLGADRLFEPARPLSEPFAVRVRVRAVIRPCLKKMVSMPRMSELPIFKDCPRRNRERRPAAPGGGPSDHGRSRGEGTCENCLAVSSYGAVDHISELAEFAIHRGCVKDFEHQQSWSRSGGCLLFSANGTG